MNKDDKDQVANDDQELANVLAEVNGTTSASSAVPVTTDADEPQYIEPPVMSDGGLGEDTANQGGILDDSPVSLPEPEQPMVPEPPTPMPTAEASFAPTPSAVDATSGAGNSELDSIKQQAIGELRPLVDKLNVSPEEKFDTLLLLIRSTDDRSLLAPAHQAAREIMDESRKAKALLDIIKEVDYLSNNQ